MALAFIPKTLQKSPIKMTSFYYLPLFKILNTKDGMKKIEYKKLVIKEKRKIDSWRGRSGAADRAWLKLSYWTVQDQYI